METLRRFLGKKSSRDMVALLSLATLPFVFFSKIALVQAALNALDLQLIFYPQRKLLGDLFRQGVLPLWNPFAFSGEPLIGNGQFGFLYPPNWLCCFLPALMALNYYILLQFGIAGTGTYLLARSLKLDSYCSFLAAVAYMFSGPVVGHQIHPDIMGAAAMLPWVVLGVFQVFERGAARWYAGAAVAVALQLVAGHPQLPLYTAASMGLYAVLLCGWHFRSCSGWTSFKPLLQLAGIYALATGVAAVQLFPWANMARLSVRAAGASSDFVFGGIMERRHPLLLLFPYLEDSVGSTWYSPKSIEAYNSMRWEHSYYVGIPTLMLAAVACATILLRFVRGRQEPWFSHFRRTQIVGVYVLGAVGLLFTVARPGWLRAVLFAMPVLGRFRHLGRSMPLLAVALALLAGCGMHILLNGGGFRWRILVRSLAVCSAVGPVMLAWLIASPFGSTIFGLPATSGGVAHFGPGSWNALIPQMIGLATGALLSWWTCHPVSYWTRGLTATLLIVDMYLFAVPFFPTVTPDYFETESPAARFLRQNLASHRKATFSPSMPPVSNLKAIVFPQWGFVNQIQDINGFSSLQSRRYADYLQSTGADDVSYGQIRDMRVLQPEHPLLSSLDVKYVLVPTGVPATVGRHLKPVFSDQHVQIFENTKVLSRAYFSSTAHCEDDPSRVLKRVTSPGFDPKELALVEGCNSHALDVEPVLALDRVSNLHWEPNSIVVSTSANGKRFLVLSEMYFPGWQATVDGKQTPIYRANYIFRGIVVPPGDHTVVFRYLPLDVRVGLLVSLISIAFVCWLFARSREPEFA